jgi:hypothetical protein
MNLAKSHQPARSPSWLSVLPIVGLVLVSFTSCSTSVAKPPSKAAAFHDDMRKLWEDHIVYTRNFIIDAAASLPGQQATTERLLRNQDDIGNAIKSYYGEENGAKLTALLKEHITTAAELVTSAKANDTAKVEDAKKRWFANADAIASFLSGANPKNWPEADMKSMMHDHLSLTNDEAAAQLKSDWKGSIDAYDKIHEQILRMADMLSTGIVAQFPKQF